VVRDDRRTSETSVDNHSTRQYNPEDSSEHHTRRRDNLKSHVQRTVTTQDLRMKERVGRLTSELVGVKRFITQQYLVCRSRIIPNYI
jgi:hypothetical protein